MCSFIYGLLFNFLVKESYTIKEQNVLVEKLLNGNSYQQDSDDEPIKRSKGLIRGAEVARPYSSGKRVGKGRY